MNATIEFRPERQMEHVRDTLQQIVIDAVRRAPPEEIPLLAWPLACGAAVAEKTRALSFKEGELAIQVPDAAWRTQLLSLTGEYLRQLREITGGRVQRLRFLLPNELDQK